MSLGNGNPKQGDKGSNFSYELKVIRNLNLIAAATGGGATEATLLMVLASLQNGQEFEQNLVMDLGGVGCPAACPTYLQVRIWDIVTHTFNPPIYYDASGTLVVPVGPLQIVNPQYVLDNILLQLTAINADLDVALSTRASEATLLSIDDGIPATLGQTLMAASMPVVIASDQSAVLVTLPSGAQVITSSIEVNSLSSPVTAGATSVGFTTNVAFVGTINGVARDKSTFYLFEAAPGKTLPAIAFTVTGGSLIIDKIV